MKQYEFFDVDDFISDEYFIEWVLNPQAEHISFWENWQTDFPQHVAKLTVAKRTIETLTVRPLEDGLSTKESNQIAAIVQQRIGIKKRPIIRLQNIKAWVTIAAVLTISIPGIWVLTTHRPTSNSEKLITTNDIEYINTTKENKLIRFKDGSLAILKPSSKLTYPETFIGQTRTVHLEGEAFFEVQKNPKKPFLVYSQDMVTQVVGTSFSVSAFGKQDEFKVIVNTGKVKVYHKNADPIAASKIITLVPHQQAIYKRSRTTFKKDTVQSKLLLSAEIANKSFTLNKVSLAEVIVKLQEAYGIEISYNKEELGSLPLTAQLANLPLDQKVELICKAINANCKFANGQIVIYK